MGSKDNPSGSDGRTVIRGGARPAADQARSGSMPTNPSRTPQPNATVIYDGPLQPPAPANSGTLFFSGDAPNAAEWGKPGIPARRPPPGNEAKVPFEAVLAAAANVGYSAGNPFLAAAAPLFNLFGRLRQSTAEIDQDQLATHIAEGIREFERKVAATDALPADARIAKYALCETADDVVQNLPGVDKAAWMSRGMLSQFFQTSVSGVGFFDALNKVLSNPETHHELLELMHACLSLGFEGQYRGVAAQRQSLERVRQDVYETLRYFKEKPGAELSPHWQGLSAAMANRSWRIPLWAIAAGAVAIVAGAFFTMRVAIIDEGEAMADDLLALSSSAPVALQRATFVPVKAEPPKPVTTQLERIRAALASDINDGNLAVDQKGEFIVVEINNLLLFASGRAEIKSEFEPIAGRIAAALDPEKGPIKIVGHTDNVKPRKSNAFKSNFDLSVARAKAVETVVAPKICRPRAYRRRGQGRG